MSAGGGWDSRLEVLMLGRQTGTDRKRTTQSNRRWMLTFAAAAAVAGTVAAMPVRAQGDVAEAVMVAAGQWALQQVPGGSPHLDPHRSGAGKDAARIQRVARALGADLTTLDRSRQCEDAMNPATCRLTVERLLTIAEPRIDGDRATVKVYAWYRSGSQSEPVAQRRWTVVVERDGSAWRVVSGG